MSFIQLTDYLALPKASRPNTNDLITRLSDEIAELKDPYWFHDASPAAQRNTLQRIDVYTSHRDALAALQHRHMLVTMPDTEYSRTVHSVLYQLHHGLCPNRIAVYMARYPLCGFFAPIDR